MCKIMNAEERIKSEQEHIEHMKGVIKFSEESIKESEKIIERLKAEIKKQDEPPDDVWKIPIEMPQKEFGIYGMGNEDEGVFGYTVDYAGYMSKIKVIKSKWRTVEGHSYRRIFPTQKYAEMFREKTQLIADCLHFKWLYDRAYVPDWKSEDCDKWYVYKEYSTDIPEYTAGVTDTYDDNHIYFSSEKIAEKCAEWLNYVYGEKKEE